MDDPFDDLTADKERLAAQRQQAAEDLFGPVSEDEGQAAVRAAPPGTGLAQAGADPTGAARQANEDEEKKVSDAVRAYDANDEAIKARASEHGFWNQLCAEGEATLAASVVE